MYISINGDCRKAFLLTAAEEVSQTTRIIMDQRGLNIIGMTVEQATRALLRGALPCMEQQQLRRLIGSELTQLSPQQTRRLIELGDALIIEQSQSADPLSAALRERLRHWLEQGRIDFDGFCRFNRAAIGQQLHTLLTRALSILAEQQEQERMLDILHCYAEHRCAAVKGIPLLWLRLLPDGCCQLWRPQDKGMQLIEAGGIERCAPLLPSIVLEYAPQRLLISGSELLPPGALVILQAMFGERIAMINSLHDSIDNAMRQGGDMTTAAAEKPPADKSAASSADDAAAAHTADANKKTAENDLTTCSSNGTMQ